MNVVYEGQELKGCQYTGMHRITTFRSMMDRIYNGGPIIL